MRFPSAVQLAYHKGNNFAEAEAARNRIRNGGNYFWLVESLPGPGQGLTDARN